MISPPEILNLTLNLANNASVSFSGALAAAVLFPTGEMMFFPDWGLSLTGLDMDFPAGFEITNWPLLLTEVPDSVPTVDYVAYAGVFGSSDFDCALSELAQVTWRIEAGR